MRRQRTVRRSEVDLLARPPAVVRSTAPAWLTTMIDPVEQLTELANLCERGFISTAEFERQKAKVLRS